MSGSRIISSGVSVLLWMALWMVPPAQAQEVEVPPGKRYVYKQSVGSPQELEVYFPANHMPGGARVPGVLLFHGGGWSSGNLAQFRYACQYLASRGLVAATANYGMLRKQNRSRLPVGESYKRVCIADAKSAIRWMQAQATELGMDPERLVVGGGSAGAHIAVLATINPGLNDPLDPQGFDTQVFAYLLFNPAFAEDDAKDPEVDVLKHLQTNFPPTFVTFGTKDHWKKGWDEVHRRLPLPSKTRVEYWLAQDQGHGFFNEQPWKDATLLQADAFLVSLGLLEGESTLQPASENANLSRVP